MSITLMAYPMAFLIAPEEAKKEELRIKTVGNDKNKTIATENLKFIKVLTNITPNELERFMNEVGTFQYDPKHYFINSTNLDIKIENTEDFITFRISGTDNPSILLSSSEALFTDLDRIARRNVRVINNKETFYYNYTTNYESIKEIYAELKKQKAKQIRETDINELTATLKGQNIRYYKIEPDIRFMLEIEQKITIMDIGRFDQYSDQDISYRLTNLKIRTNIKTEEELKHLLESVKYGYYEGGQTPLRNSYADLKWVIKDGYYVAEFSGQNNTAIIKESEILFRKMNIAAKRDLRLVNEISTVIYTYNTNYTDKGILLNTLYEHGATEITENNDEISCKLFNMEMRYYKSETGAYTLDITQNSNKAECEDLIQDLNEEYGLNMQEITYNKIKERLQQENLNIDSETVLDDNTIVLTIDI